MSKRKPLFTKLTIVDDGTTYKGDLEDVMHEVAQKYDLDQIVWGRKKKR
jgi:hypothetical protein